MSVNKKGSESDLAEVDAYRNTASDYEEIPELTDEDFARGTVRENGVVISRPRGRPPIGDHPKQQVTLRIDQDILEHFRGLGAGWQSMINAALREKVASAKADADR